MSITENVKSKIRKSTFSIAKTAAAITIVAAVALSFVCIAIAVFFFKKEATSMYEEMEMSLTGAIYSQVDKKNLDEVIAKVDNQFQMLQNTSDIPKEHTKEFAANFKEIENTEQYQKLWDHLNFMRGGTNATAIDLVLFYPELNRGIYIIDASDFNILPCGYIFSMDMKEYRGQMGRDFIGFNSVSRKFGRVRTDGISVYVDEANQMTAYLLADIPISHVINRSVVFLVQTVTVAVVFILILTLLIFTFMQRIIVAPINAIANTSEYFVGEYESRVDTKTETHVFDDLYKGRIREFLNTARSLKSMELEMNSYIRDLDIMINEKSRINTELDIATKIQKGFIPRNYDDLKNYYQLELYGNMAPAREVGGDFYDFYLIDDDHLALVMADVSGKGIPAALFMIVSKILLHEIAKAGGKPSEVLTLINNKLCEHNVADMFVTIWFGILTISTGKVVASNAGHEYPAITDEYNNYAILKDKHGFVVGGMDGAKYFDYEFTIPRNGKLFLYTDGLPEANNKESEFFGTERMIEKLNECREMNPKNTIEHMYAAVDEFTEDAEAFDDLTMLCIWYKGN